MDRHVGEIMTKALWTALENDPLEKVEELMSRHRLSSVPVVDPHGRIFGILSSSDLLRFRESRGNVKAAHAWELCTYRPIEVGSTMSVRDAAQLMVKHKIHHVVVTDGHEAVGFVSALDIVEQYLLQAKAS
jgi:CBS domain-containing protein